LITPVILALDLSTSRGSVALYGPGLAVQHDLPAQRRHNEQALPLIDTLLRENGAAPPDIELLALGAGPGSFTGLRVAAGIVQGLAFALTRPVVCVSSLRVTACAAASLGAGAVLVAVDAHMGECYWGSYRLQDGTPVALHDDCLSRESEIALPGVATGAVDAVVGDAELVGRLADRFAVAGRAASPSALDLARIAGTEPRAAHVPAFAAQPVYLRGAGAWKTLSEQGR
jgi:tRNA threonylcarbamoyladenosine biosynthesis protein TsaB